MRKVKYNSRLNEETKIGFFVAFTPEANVIIETKDGEIRFLSPSQIQFIDTPEDEQRAEFAKAALAGVPSRFQNSQGEWENRNPSNIAKNAIYIADAIIEQLNAPKA